MNTNMLIKHSAAVHISNNISAVDRKIYNLLVKKAYGELLTKEDHVIYIDEIISRLHDSCYKNYKFVQDSILKLVDSSVKFNVLGRDRKNKWVGAISLLSAAHFIDGCVHYSFPKELSCLLAKPNVYTTLDLQYQKVLKGKYSIALWEFLNEQLDIKKALKVKTNFFDLEVILDLLGVQDTASYQGFKEINRRIIRPSIEEINSFTDIEASFETENKNRKVKSISFSISRRKSLLAEKLNINNMEESESDFTEEEKEIYNKGAFLNMKRDEITDLLKKHSRSDIGNVFDFVKTKIGEKNDIKNVSGYVWTLLNRGLYHKQSNEQKGETEPVREQNYFALWKERVGEGLDGEIVVLYETMCKHFGPSVFNNWFTKLHFLTIYDKKIYFIADTKFVREWVLNNYKEGILRLANLLGIIVNDMTVDVRDKLAGEVAASGYRTARQLVLS